MIDAGPAAVGGFKLDEVDGYDRYLWPDTALFPSGRDAEQLRQTYGLLLQKAVFDAFHQANRRTMGQIRGTNAGASPYPFVIYNDNYEFDGYITAVSNSGFAGVLWSPEVRGNGELEKRLSDATKEGRSEDAAKLRADIAADLIRRMQAVCFSPLSLYNGWASTTRLWTHPEAKDGIKDAIVLRGRLLPYLYNTFAQYHHEGTPPIRPMQLAAGVAAHAPTAESGKLDATANPYEVPPAVREVKDQYMFGDSLLVAPIPPGTPTRKVLLPPGKWYDFHTGKYAGANETIDVTPGLATMPVFVKDGALIPMIAARTHAPAAGETVALEVRHYGEAPGSLALYDDDGETFDFEKGAFSWTALAVTKDAAGQWQGKVTPDANGKKWSYGEVTWTFMTAP